MAVQFTSAHTYWSPHAERCRSPRPRL